jgi:hypothetical protein
MSGLLFRHYLVDTHLAPINDDGNPLNSYQHHCCQRNNFYRITMIMMLLFLPILLTTVLLPSSLACFAGDNLVRVLAPGQPNRQFDGFDTDADKVFLLSMQDLEIGDRVQVEGGRFERIYSFAQYETDQEYPYVQVVAVNATQGFVHLAANQMLKVGASGSSKEKYLPAFSIRAGQELLLAREGEGGHEDHSTATVSFVQPSTSTGTYCPLTEGGTLVVNGVVASCYSTQHPKGFVDIGGGFIHPSSHKMQQKMGALHRLFLPIDIYNKEDGTNVLLSLGDTFSQWWLTSDDDINEPSTLKMLLQLLLVVPIVACASGAWWIETLLQMREMIAILLFIGSLVARCRLCSGTEVELTLSKAK